MNSRWLAVLTSALVAAPLVPQEKEEKAPAAKEVSREDLKTVRDRASYVIGLSIGKDLLSKSVDPNLNCFMKGIQDALVHGKPLLSEAEIKTAMEEFQQEVERKHQAFAEKHRKEGEAYLARNRTQPGVETLPSGLQYKVLEAGSGPKPKATDTVIAHYRGTLIDGTEFDSSYKGGEPATFLVNRVIPGWTEALQLMPVGSKWQLFIPSSLAYGEDGAGSEIPPNATLVFEVQLVSIQ